jgi:transposase
MRQRPSKATRRGLVSEAGPCGSGLSRSLTKKGDDGWGVAPSWLPKKAGDRVKTDRREALHLARLMRSGDLTPVSVPKVEDEAMRALCRARAEALRARTAATWRLQAFVRRHDIRSTGHAAGNPAHLRWRSAGVCPTPAPHIVCHAYVRAVNEPTERLQRRAQDRQAHGTPWRGPPVVAALQALRGVQCTVAVTTVAARGDLTRFDNPRQRMDDGGLPPSASARGPRRRQGAMTTTGTSHARRALGEGAGASRYPAKVRRH